MKIDSITIKNFKKINNISLDLSGQFNLIVGENGTGKTSVLEALCVAMGAFLSGIDGIPSVNFTKDEIRRETLLYGEASLEYQYKLPVEITCDMLIDGEHFEVTRHKRKLNSSRTTVEPRNITNIARNMLEDLNKVLPVLCYQGISRLSDQKRKKWGGSVRTAESRRNGYMDCMDASSSMKMINSWFKRMDHISLQKHKVVAEYAAVTNAAENFMKHMLDYAKEIHIYYDATEGEIVYERGKQVLPLRLLSSGFRTLVGMVMDIAYRMAVLNPFLGEKITQETDGMVLIDELDMHLHPTWQWRVISALKNTFPKVQFVATTHSPLIISSVEDNDKVVSMSDLCGGLPEYLLPSKGWLVGDVLTERMGTMDRSPQIIEKLARLKVLGKKRMTGVFSDKELAEYNGLISELKDMLPENDTVIEEVALFNLREMVAFENDKSKKV